MRILHVNDRVRLIDDVPETNLVRGCVGVICSQWSSYDEPVYEVEFFSDECDGVSRFLLRQSQIESDAVEELAID